MDRDWGSRLERYYKLRTPRDEKLSGFRPIVRYLRSKKIEEILLQPLFIYKNETCLDINGKHLIEALINGRPRSTSCSILREISHVSLRARDRRSTRERTSGRAQEKEEDARGGKGKGERVVRWVGTKEAHNLPRCFLVVWLSRWRERIMPDDWSGRKRSFANAIFDFTRLNGHERNPI